MSTNPKDRHGSKKIGFEHVPISGLYLLSLGLYQGWKKYGQFNWRVTDVRMSVYLNAIQRHLNELWAGQDVASDGTYNLAHIVANCAIIFDGWLFGRLIDDRMTSVDEIGERLHEISVEQRVRMDGFVTEFKKSQTPAIEQPRRPRGLSRYFYWRRP